MSCKNQNEWIAKLKESWPESPKHKIVIDYGGGNIAEIELDIFQMSAMNGELTIKFKEVDNADHPEDNQPILNQH